MLTGLLILPDTDLRVPSAEQMGGSLHGWDLTRTGT